MYRDLWTWEKCRQKIQTLKDRLGFPNSPTLKFLKLTLSLETGRIHDEIRNQPFAEIEPGVYCTLSTYAESKPAAETHKLISFSELPRGQGYNNAFIRRAVQPIAKTFASDVQRLWDAAKVFDAERLSFGDCSVKIHALPLVPLVAILYGSTSEFPASANMLFESSASSYLSTEQLAFLGELTKVRLRHAHEAIT